METREVLKEFLDKKFNGVDFTENDLSFLEQYSIKHDKKESQCIKEFKYEKNDTIYKTVTGYYKANPCVEEAKKTLQNFRKLTAENFTSAVIEENQVHFLRTIF